jgi:hypothetical protein
MIGTPSYDGRLGFGYVSSMLETATEFQSRGWSWSPFLLGGCSLIEMARQDIVAQFMASNATHLLMVDSDISWRARDLVRMIEADEPLLFAVAPKRLSTDFAIRYLDGNSVRVLDDGIVEVEAAGGGFALIRRDCIEHMQAFYPELKYRNSPEAVDSYGLYMLELADGTLYGEDYAFARRWRKAGGRALVDPEVWLRHSHGSYHVEGCLADTIPEVRDRFSSHLHEAIFALPSRGRPESMQRFIDAYRATKARATMFVWVDDDDPRIEDYRRLDYPPHWQVNYGPRFANACNGVVEEMFRLFPQASCYGLMSDDVVPRTSHWDLKLANAAGRDRLAYGDDGFQGRNLATHPVIGGDLVRAIGWIVLPCVKHSFVDTALHTIAQGTGRIVYVGEVKTEHLHPLAGKAPNDATYRFRESFTEDREAFSKWAETDLPIIAARVNALGTASQPVGVCAGGGL